MENQCSFMWIQGSVEVLGLFVLYWICKIGLYLGKKKSLFSGFFNKLNFEKIFLTPLKAILFSFAAYVLIVLMTTHFSCISVAPVAKMLRDAIVVAAVSWMVYQWKSEFFERNCILQTFPNQGGSSSVSKLLSAIIFLIAGLMILRIFHLDIVPLIAFGGIGAAAIGFAARDVIGNFFGGAMLSVTRPFVKGDYIVLPDRNVEGIVEEIGWYLTSIRDRDNRPVYCPNSLFSNFLVINEARRIERRIRETFWIKYTDFSKVTMLTDAIRAYLKAQPDVDLRAPVLVYLNGFGEYCLEVYLEVYVLKRKLSDYLPVKERILAEILTIANQMNVDVSFPVPSIELGKK